MLEKVKKDTIIKKFQAHEKDTGSSALQVALLTERIESLNKHFEVFPKDYASRTGLMRCVGQRRKLLAYLKRQDMAQYKDVIASLGLRR